MNYERNRYFLKIYQLQDDKEKALIKALENKKNEDWAEVKKIFEQIENLEDKLRREFAGYITWKERAKKVKLTHPLIKNVNEYQSYTELYWAQKISWGQYRRNKKKRLLV